MTDRKLWKSGLSIGRLSEESLQRAAEAGLDLVEISCIKDDDPANWALVPEWEKKTGVKAWSCHLPFGWWGDNWADPTADDPEKWQITLDRDIPLIEGCGRAGIKYMVIHPSREPFKDEDREKYMQLAIERLKILSDICKENGCVLCIEDLPRTCLGRDSDEMLRFMETNPDLRICFDVNHLLRENHVDFVKKVGKWIVTTHISDYDFTDEKHWFPMDGKIDWKELQQALEEADYTGPFLYETMPKEYTWADVKKNHNKLKEL